MGEWILAGKGKIIQRSTKMMIPSQPPKNPVEGDRYFNIHLNAMCIFHDGMWHEITTKEEDFDFNWNSNYIQLPLEGA